MYNYNITADSNKFTEDIEVKITDCFAQSITTQMFIYQNDPDDWSSIQVQKNNFKVCFLSF